MKAQIIIVSIRSPHKSKGRLLGDRQKLAVGAVSIRSPHKSKGRPIVVFIFHHPRKFQSAPLTKARGDTTYSPRPAARSCFNPLPSQKQGETAHV